MTARWWRPDQLAQRRDKLLARGRILAAVRRFFDAAGYIEVETPALQLSPGLEPHLKAFATVLHDPERRCTVTPSAYLAGICDEEAAGRRREPDLAIGAGVPRRRAQRHPSPRILDARMVPRRRLVSRSDGRMRGLVASGPDAAGGVPLRWHGHQVDARGPWQRLSVADAFRHHLGIDLLATAPDPGHPDVGMLARVAAPLGIKPHAGDDWDDLFFRIFLDHIEPKLGLDAPTILYDYPISMAALSRPKPGDPRLAERFELYVGGLELANAFGELTDTIEQRRRFLADQSKKQALYGESYPIDEDFLAALEEGLPECAGIALGFDRLVMLATGADDIEDVLWAPVA